MKKKQLNDEELRELDNYLSNELNYDIYSEMTKKNYVRHFEPLNFFRLFHSQIEFIQKNKKKPSLVTKTLSELNLTDDQKEFLFDYLIVHFELEADEDTDIRICFRQIEELQQELNFSEDETEENLTEENLTIESKDQFQELIEHIETLPTYKERIAYIITERTKDQQSDNSLDFDWGTAVSFSNKCSLEIEKYKELIKLEGNQKELKNGSKKHKDLTLDRAVLFMDYLFRFTKTNSFNKAKAEAISFLTGYSFETLRQRLSSINEDKNKKN